MPLAHPSHTLVRVPATAPLHRTRRSALLTQPAPPALQSVEGLQRHVQALSAQLAETQASLRAERRQSDQWERCVRELSNGTLALADPCPSPLAPHPTLTLALADPRLSPLPLGYQPLPSHPSPHLSAPRPSAPQPLGPRPSPGIFLNARMNAKYEQRVASRLDAALSKLDHVGSVRCINCPFPNTNPNPSPNPSPNPN